MFKEIKKQGRMEKEKRNMILIKDQDTAES
jgi:hypothetical protein